MGYMILIVSIFILMVTLSVTLVKYSKLRENNRELEMELSKLRDVYHDMLYDNCVLADKIEKIKNLNLIDYSDNDYYKELLNIK